MIAAPWKGKRLLDGLSQQPSLRRCVTVSMALTSPKTLPSRKEGGEVSTLPPLPMMITRPPYDQAAGEKRQAEGRKEPEIDQYTRHINVSFPECVSFFGLSGCSVISIQTHRQKYSEIHRSLSGLTNVFPFALERGHHPFSLLGSLSLRGAHHGERKSCLALCVPQIW
jgi:hypothetical protein